MNLVQIQQALQTMPMPNIIKYANGDDSTVPSYMALAELNRRKMLQDQATAAEQVPQQTVKQNLENSITKPNQLAVNPTTPQQQQVNPADQTQQVNPAAQSQQVNPAAPPQQVSPYQTPAVAAAPSDSFKHGGLASLPVHMFKQHNFAPGGIIAFDDGGFTSTRQQALNALNQTMPDRQGNQSMGEYLASPENRQYLNDRQTAYNAIINNTLTPMSPDAARAYQTTYRRAPSDVEIMQPVVNSNAPASSSTTAAPSVNAQSNETPAAPAVRPTVANSNVARPTDNTPSAPIATNAPTTGVVQTGKPMSMTQLSDAQQQRLNNFYQMPSELQVKPEKTAEQIYAENQAIKKLAGVSDNPFAESKKRYEAIEARQKEQMASDPMDRLIAQANAFATADPSKGFGYQAAMSASASQALKKEQDALREQQAITMAKLYTEYDKEDDARKRGDAAAIKTSQEAQQKHNDDLLKLQNEWTNAQSGRMNADSNASNAIANQFQAQYKPQEVANQGVAASAAMINAKKPPSEIQIANEYANNPTFAKAWDAMQTTKTNAANEQKMRDDWSKDAALRMQYDNDFEKYKKSVGVAAGFGGNFNPSNYPPVYTAPDGAVYSMTPNGYVLTTPAPKK
jgi:hypothetical protein